MKKVIIFILGILLLAFVGYCVKVVYKNTQGFTKDFTSYYVETDDKTIYQGDKITIPEGESKYFTLKSFLGEEINDVDVKITTGSKTFSYKVNDKVYSFASLKDITKFFEIKISGNTFTIKGRDIVDVLKEYHGADVEILSDITNWAEDCVNVHVYTGDKYVAHFSINSDIKITGVKILEKIEF